MADVVINLYIQCQREKMDLCLLVVPLRIIWLHRGMVNFQANENSCINREKSGLWVINCIARRVRFTPQSDTNSTNFFFISTMSNTFTAPSARRTVTKFVEPRNTIQEVVNSVLFAQKLMLQLIAELNALSLDDWHKMSWYPTNATFNSRNKSFTSRWTHTDEMKFIEVEKNIYEGNFTPLSASKWKKSARAKQGVLDEWIERHCWAATLHAKFRDANRCLFFLSKTL